MAGLNQFDPAPPIARDDESFLRKLAFVINETQKGKTNNTGEVTLTNGTTSTVVSNPLCNAKSVIVLDRNSSLAAGLTGVYTTKANGSFTIFHSNPGGTTAVFRYAIIG